MKCPETLETRPGVNPSPFASAFTQGVPVREGLQLLFRIVRDKSIKEAILFGIYVIIFLLISFQVCALPRSHRVPCAAGVLTPLIPCALQLWDAHSAFLQNDALNNIFVRGNFGEYVGRSATVAFACPCAHVLLCLHTARTR